MYPEAHEEESQFPPVLGLGPYLGEGEWLYKDTLRLEYVSVFSCHDIPL